MDPAPLQQLSSVTLADQAYEALRGVLIAGDLAPGQKVTERALAAQLNVSVTPVREAIRRLEQDRLVVRTGPRSVHVAALTESGKEDAVLIEASLRALAARLAAGRASDAQLQVMSDTLNMADEQRARLKAADEDGLLVLLGTMRRFHSLIDEASGSQLLLHMLRQAEAFDAAARAHWLKAQRRLGSSRPAGRYDEHRQILDALLARDPDLAERLVLQHSRTVGVEMAQDLA